MPDGEADPAVGGVDHPFPGERGESGVRPAGRGERWFYQPTIFAGVKAGSRLEQEEIFGPVLSVIRVNSYEDAARVNKFMIHVVTA